MPQPTKTEIATLNRHDRMMMLVEAPYARAIIREKNKYISAVAKAYLVDGTIPDALTLQHRSDMFEISKRYNSRIIMMMSRDVHNNIKSVFENFRKKTQGQTLSNSKTNAQIANALVRGTQIEIHERYLKDAAFDRWIISILGFWISEETAAAAGITAETTREDIQEAIRLSLENGDTSVQTAKAILKVKGLSAFRAATIARTETHNAAMYANKESGKRLIRETGVELLKVWVPVQDSRTRDAHRVMSSHEAIVMDALFNVGGVRMDRPGDPRGGASNVINCRCTLVYRVAE